VEIVLKYFTRPMHFFGRTGLASFTVGGLILAFLLVKEILGHEIRMALGRCCSRAGCCC
jgi:hypothetical protein